jgi:fatty acid/phospholipid biosynthesis enzyme
VLSGLVYAGSFQSGMARAVVLDIGANAECRPEFLVQFAVMGQIYAQSMLGVASPRIGLLSNGEEEGKGNDLVRETFPLLRHLTSTSSAMSRERSSSMGWPMLSSQMVLQVMFCSNRQRRLPN